MLGGPRLPAPEESQIAVRPAETFLQTASKSSWPLAQPHRDCWSGPTQSLANLAPQRLRRYRRIRLRRHQMPQRLIQTATYPHPAERRAARRSTQTQTASLAAPLQRRWAILSQRPKRLSPLSPNRFLNYERRALTCSHRLVQPPQDKISCSSTSHAYSCTQPSLSFLQWSPPTGQTSGLY